MVNNESTIEKLTGTFSDQLSATESMRQELKSLISYLNLAGTDVASFILNCYREYTGSKPDPDKPLSKKEGALFLHALSVKVRKVFPDVSGENNVTQLSGIKKGSTVFSEIYVEKGALTYPLTNRILSRFPERKVTEIAHYKDIFNVAGQDFLAQKRSPALILAVNNGRRIYDGARPCQSFGHEYFTYTSQVKNCLYDCEYCFLRGMYPSGNIVIFVNTDDYFSDIDAELKDHPLYLSIAYDTDLLALEGFTGIVKKYCEFAANRPELLIEIRTKCASGTVYDMLKTVSVDNAGSNFFPSNIILAYTISPEPIAKAYEHWAGSFQARKSAIYSSLRAGIRTRLCIDPMIAVKGWQDIYGNMIDELFSDPVMTKLEDISVGTFRISSSYIKRLKKTALTQISAYPYENTDGMCGYDEKLRMEMTEFVKERIGRYFPTEKIFISDY